MEQRKCHGVSNDSVYQMCKVETAFGCHTALGEIRNKLHPCCLKQNGSMNPLNNTDNERSFSMMFTIFPNPIWPRDDGNLMEK